MICTGYSSWVIVLSTSDTQTVENNSFVSYEVDDLRLSAHGIGLSATGAKTFTYCTVTAGGGNPVTQYTNLSLSIFINIERAKLSQWAQNDYRGKNLVITATSSGTNAHSIKSIARYYLAPMQAKLTLLGYPNLYLSVSASISNELTVTIPLEQLYNLVILDKANANNASSTLELTIDFAEQGSALLQEKDENGNLTSVTKTFKELNDSKIPYNADSSEVPVEGTITNRERICSATYSFTAKLVKN